MKRKFLIAIGVVSLIFLLSGIYIVTTIERSMSELNTLVKLHRVEMLRENLLIEVKRAQSDLYLKNTRYARGIDTIVGHVRAISVRINDCFGCHHSPRGTKKLTGLREHIEQYKNALSRVFTIRANRQRLEAEEDSAYRIGLGLIGELNTITNMTNRRLEVRRQDSFQKIARAKNIIYLLLGLVPLVILVLSVVMARGLSQPINTLLGATRRLTGGDLDYRIVGLRNEFGEVAASFNEMAKSLKDHCAKMQWAEQLVVLGEIAGGLAHEIKNPLAGIKASMAILSQEADLTEENRDMVLKVLEQINRIESMLKSLLNFARPPKPHFLPTDLNAVVETTVGLAQNHPLFSIGETRAIVVEKQFGQELPHTQADPIQLQQVIMNLMLNAADAMPEGGTVTVRTASDHDARFLIVQIADTGNGIDHAVRDRIFQPFFTTKLAGTGLGLAIAKRLIDQHGGSIAVESSPGSGTLFTIRIPVIAMEERRES